MPDTWVTPRVWVTSERVGQSKMNEISTDLRVLFPYTTAGDIAFRDNAGAYLTRLPLTVGGILFGDATAPAYTPAGTQYQFLMSNGASDPAFASMIYRRQGGHATNWQNAGTTTYTPTAPKLQAGVKSVSVNTTGTASVTYPVAFTNRPIVLIGINSGSGAIVAHFTGDANTGFDLELRDVITAGAISVDVNWLAIGE